MPKDKRLNSLSFGHSRASPCPYNVRNSKQAKPENQLESKPEDLKEWDDVRCSICMEHPHNAVLLWCSSFHKGCRPYMCNTSYRHSNCLDQFCRSSVSSPSAVNLQDCPPPSPFHLSHSRREQSSLSRDMRSYQTDLQLKLSCPLCRGEIYGWSVVEAAREYMNSKTRSCACDTCNFTGTYNELRKHARCMHPLTRPAEVDPERQHNWTRLERERDYEDMLTTIQSVVGDDRSNSTTDSSSMSDIFLEDLHSWITLHFAYLAFLEFLGDSPASRDQAPVRRSRSRMRFRYDASPGLAPSPGARMLLHGQGDEPWSVRRVRERREHAGAGRPHRGLRWRQRQPPNNGR